MQEIVEETLSEEEVQPVAQITEQNVEPLQIGGDWNYVTTSTQGCWLLTDSEGIEHNFVAHMKDGGWSPQPGLSGSYSVEVSKSTGVCSTWSGIIILQTLDETETVPQISNPVEPTIAQRTPVDEIVEPVSYTHLTLPTKRIV